MYQFTVGYIYMGEDLVDWVPGMAELSLVVLAGVRGVSTEGCNRRDLQQVAGSRQNFQIK